MDLTTFALTSEISKCICYITKVIRSPIKKFHQKKKLNTAATLQHHHFVQAPSVRYCSTLYCVHHLAVAQPLRKCHCSATNPSSRSSVFDSYWWKDDPSRSVNRCEVASREYAANESCEVDDSPPSIIGNIVDRVELDRLNYCNCLMNMKFGSYSDAKGSWRCSNC